MGVLVGAAMETIGSGGDLYEIILIDSGEGYAAICPGVPGAVSQGTDRVDALAMIADAMATCRLYPYNGYGTVGAYYNPHNASGAWNMPRYMGNVGHLMQHWTLCELVRIAGEKGEPGLSFIDAHAMAPWATRRRYRDKTFDRVRDDRLSPCSEIAYERAWHRLLQEQGEQGYPNSAAFLEKVWDGKFSLLLCELYPPTVEVIERWFERDDKSQRCEATEVFEGDWRKRFRQGLPRPCAVGLAKESLTFISFDPYKYDSRQWEQAQPNGDLYPEDMELIVSQLSQLESGILIQLSTYSNARSHNPHANVRQSLDQIMEPNSFKLLAAVEVPNDDHMMSLVYARNVPWADELENLPANFRQWFEAVRM